MSCFVFDQKFGFSGITSLPVTIACFWSFLYGVFFLWFNRIKEHERQFAFRSRFVGRKRVPATHRRMCVRGKVISFRHCASLHPHCRFQHGSWKKISFFNPHRAKKFIDDRHLSRLSTMPFESWSSSERGGRKEPFDLVPLECLLQLSRKCSVHTSFLGAPGPNHGFVQKSSVANRCLSRFRSIIPLSRSVICECFGASRLVLNLLCWWPLMLCVSIRVSLCPDLKQSGLRMANRDGLVLCWWSPKRFARWECLFRE